MDQGSHNTLFTTSSEGLFDELNTAEDPHTSGCWKMQSSTAECKDIGNSMDTIQHSSSAHISQGLFQINCRI